MECLRGSGRKHFFLSPLGLVLILVIGLLVRIVVGTLFTYGYDVYHWALVMSNLSSGNGLYGLAGYFYTPVWGYILSFFNMCQQSFLTLGDTAYRVVEALGFEAYDGYISANTTSMVFAFWIKLPLYLVDLLVAYLIFRTVLDITCDRRKACFGFILWIFNPLVICSPAVQGMFDNITALLTILCFLGLRKRMYLLAGAMLGLATLLKLFPFFLLPLAVAYVIVRENRDLRRGLAMVLRAAVGFILVLAIVFIPQLMDGTIVDCFSFVFERASSGNDSLHRLMSFGSVLAYVLIIIGSCVIAVAFYRTAGKDLDRELLTAVLVNLTLVFLYPPTPQYLVLLIPFLAVYVSTVNRSFLRPLIVISIAAAGYMLANNFTLLLTLAHDTGIISVDTVISLSDSFQPFWFAVYYAFGVIQSLGVFYLAYLEYKCRVMPVRIWKKVVPSNS